MANPGVMKNAPTRPRQQSLFQACQWPASCEDMPHHAGHDHHHHKRDDERQRRRSVCRPSIGAHPDAGSRPSTAWTRPCTRSHRKPARGRRRDHIQNFHFVPFPFFRQAYTRGPSTSTALNAAQLADDVPFCRRHGLHRQPRVLHQNHGLQIGMGADLGQGNRPMNGRNARTSTHPSADRRWCYRGAPIRKPRQCLPPPFPPLYR